MPEPELDYTGSAEVRFGHSISQVERATDGGGQQTKHALSIFRVEQRLYILLNLLQNKRSSRGNVAIIATVQNGVRVARKTDSAWAVGRVALVDRHPPLKSTGWRRGRRRRSGVHVQELRVCLAHARYSLLPLRNLGVLLVLALRVCLATARLSTNPRRRVVFLVHVLRVCLACARLSNTIGGYRRQPKAYFTATVRMDMTTVHNHKTWQQSLQ
mmetsp:Transcript_77884/g.228349  ORF Transcript_77884/g.228349 Transcript_77884/m.228349 type:complete len:214 (-) Transcript_77884:263-904(-)